MHYMSILFVYAGLRMLRNLLTAVVEEAIVGLYSVYCMVDM